jgi:hypothetical protein
LLKDEAIAYLKELLKIYNLGLTKPLNFFPENSFKFVGNLIIKDKNNYEAIWLLKDAFFNKEFGEFNKPYNTYFFNEKDVLNKDFEDYSLKIFKPIYNALL